MEFKSCKILQWSLKIYTPHGSVVAQLRCGGIFDYCIIANFQQSMPVKELAKLVSIWQRYELTHV